MIVFSDLQWNLVTWCSFALLKVIFKRMEVKKKFSDALPESFLNFKPIN